MTKPSKATPIPCPGKNKGCYCGQSNHGWLVGRFSCTTMGEDPALEAEAKRIEVAVNAYDAARELAKFASKAPEQIDFPSDAAWQRAFWRWAAEVSDKAREVLRLMEVDNG